MLLILALNILKIFVKSGLSLRPIYVLLSVASAFCSREAEGGGNCQLDISSCLVVVSYSVPLFFPTRLQLNKKIQQLEKYMQKSTQDDERQRSHSMALTTATQGLQPMTPVSTFTTSTYAVDPDRIRSNVHIGSESGYGGTWNSPMPFSYTDNLGVPSAPVEREVFTPKLIDVKYIEGSSDKRWKSMDFPWTKKLEVLC